MWANGDQCSGQFTNLTLLTATQKPNNIKTNFYRNNSSFMCLCMSGAFDLLSV